VQSLPISLLFVLGALATRCEEIRLFPCVWRLRASRVLFPVLIRGAPPVILPCSQSADNDIGCTLGHSAGHIARSTLMPQDPRISVVYCGRPPVFFLPLTNLDLLPFFCMKSRPFPQFRGFSSSLFGAVAFSRDMAGIPHGFSIPREASPTPLPPQGPDGRFLPFPLHNARSATHRSSSPPPPLL